MAPTRARMLALRPARPPTAELEAVPLGVKNGSPYERRLTKLLRRAWEGGVEDAVRGAAGVLGADADALTSAVASHLFEHHSVEVQVDHVDAVDKEWTAVEHKLVSIMEERGLDLELACASIGLSVDRLKRRTEDDPLLGERLQIAWERGTVKLYSVLWKLSLSGAKGSDRTALALLRARDPRFQEVIRHEISEGDILKSAAFLSVLERILRVFSITVPEGESEDYRRGWADAMAAARRKADEDLG
jgi:hypothetical protein